MYLWALVLLSFCRTDPAEAEAQFFDTLTAGKRYYTGGNGYSRSSPSYNVPNKPSYNGKPSYNSAPSYKPSYEGINFKTVQIPVPDLDLPSPVDFKVGVLRSKGRIASGLLHAKAGILRAGASILAQKAAVLDRVAHTIPAVKAHLIQQLKHHAGDSGSYGAPQQRPNYQTSYGAPSSGNRAPSSGYGAPSSGYGAPSSGYGAPSSNYGSPSNGYGAPQGPTRDNPFIPSQPNIVTSNNNNNNNIPLSASINVGNNVDSYGSPQGNPLTTTNVQQSNVLPNNNNLISNNNNFISNNNNFIPNNNNILSSSNLLSSGNSLVSYNPMTANNPSQQTFQTNSGSIGIDNALMDSFLLQESRQPTLQTSSQLNNEICKSDDALTSLLEDIFLGHEIIPDILDEPPKYPLDLSYKTIRTFPGMHVTADMTRSKPVLHWPYEPDTLYTFVLSNLDINSRRNRTLSEFWHWFIANIPGDSVDNGEVIFELLFPLVLPEGDGDHRFGFFVFKQPGRMDYSGEGGKTDNCSPSMSNGRGPFKSTKSFLIKYNLILMASTFLIVDYNEASMEIACEWQKCIGDTINLVSPLECGEK